MCSSEQSAHSVEVYVQNYKILFTWQEDVWMVLSGRRCVIVVSVVRRDLRDWGKLLIFAEILLRMAEQLSHGVESVRAKCLVLEERYRRLVRERDDARTQIAALASQLAEQRALSERLASELRSLRMSAAISPDRDDRDALRDFLTGLVRDIDQCISDLSH